MNRNQQKTRTAARILAIIVVLAMLLMSGYYILLAFSSGDAVFYVYAAEDPETDEKNLTKLEQLRSVVEYIDENYADDVNVEDLTDAAYNGVFDALDQWSVFYKTQEDKDAFVSQVTGNYAGIGITMTLDDFGRCLISNVNTLGPAYERGVEPGMYLVEVDGVDLTGKTLEEISGMVRGEPGTKVLITTEQKGVLESRNVERRNIKAQTVSYEMLDGGIGYIAISQFSGDTYKEFRIAKLNLISEGAEKLILDLRNNGGGVMNDALNVANMLVPEGVPLVYYEQQGEIIDEYTSIGGTYKDMPLAVLINGKTASASECLAAAIRDNGAGVLVGETTYGKGLAQELVTLDNGDNFKLSFCHFLTPKKEHIDGAGIAPDHAVYNGAQMTAEQAEAAVKKLMPIEEGKKYFAGQVGLTVLAMQQRLKMMGYKVQENAVMDEATVSALKRIQAQYGASPYGGLDFCTIELVQRAFSEYLNGDGTDKQLQKAIEVLQ